MDDRIKKLLTEQRHKLAVNKNSQMSISLDSNSRPLPANKLNVSYKQSLLMLTLKR